MGLELTYTLGDLDAASALLIQVAQDRVERGEELWPPRSLTPERLERHYPRPGWRVAWHGGEAVGAYVLLGADPLFWPDDPPGEAAYLHKLGVHPGWQGRGLSHTLPKPAPWAAAFCDSTRRRSGPGCGRCTRRRASGRWTWCRPAPGGWRGSSGA